MTAEPRDDGELLRRTDAMRANADRVRSYPSYSVRQLADDARWLMGEYAEQLGQLAAADRENAELRGEVERLRKKHAERIAVYVPLVDAAEREAESNGAALIRVAAERDDLRAQLAAAERDRDEARSERDDAGLLWGRHYNDAMGALETQLAAAQAQLARLLRIFDGINDAIHNETLTEFSRLVAVSALKNVALSAAPQPEPEENACRSCGIDNPVWFAPNVTCPGPAASKDAER